MTPINNASRCGEEAFHSPGIAGKKWTILLIVALVAGWVAAVTVVPRSIWKQSGMGIGHASAGSERGVVPANLEEAPQPVAFLPGVMRDFPTFTLFGADLGGLASADGINQMVSAGSSWNRLDILWSDVETSEGLYDWTAVADLESKIRLTSSRRIETILIVRGTPAWAQAVSGYSCGPILAEKMVAFGSFLRALVARYAAAPYNVRYWEMWNEPDVDPSLVPGDSGFGCWGDAADEYYGGGAYAQMLMAAYPQIKAADPSAQVLVGGLLLDCDPRGSPSVCSALSPAHSEAPARFLEGILQSGGGAYFDGVSFHAYDLYGGLEGRYEMLNWASAWNTSGPVVYAKAGFLNEVLAGYAVSGKYLLNTENALLCDSCADDAEYETTKSWYLAQTYAAATAIGLRVNLWYSAMGWRNSGLLHSDYSFRPAYSAFRFSRREIGGAEWARDVTEFPGVRGHEFLRSGKRIWIIWSQDGDAHLVDLPALPSAIFLPDGSVVTPIDPLAVTAEPLYLEWGS